MATQAQIETIEAGRVDDTAREMARDGVELTWGEVDSIGDSRVAWLRDRLGLVSESTDVGVTFRPRS